MATVTFSNNPTSIETLPAIQELQSRPQWVCRDATKNPYNAYTGSLAKSNDPDTWASYERAKRAYEQSLATSTPYSGIGYVFNQDICGIDLDHCVHPETGQIDAWAQEILDTINSYAEYSPNDGIHILVHAHLSDEAWHK